MPTYQYKCNRCPAIDERITAIDRRNEAVGQQCVTCKRGTLELIVGGVAAFMSPEALGYHKAPEDFRNFLSAVHKANPGSQIRDR